MSLKDHTLFITGASRGIGLAIALRAARDGANIAIAVEGVSWSDPDYFTALVTQAIVGNWDRSMGNSSYLGSKLSSFVSQHNLANSFMSFSTSYSDTG